MTLNRSSETIEGTLLSDSSLRQYKSGVVFQMNQSGSPHIDWLITVKAALISLGVPIPSTYPRLLGPYISKGKSYIMAQLHSLETDILQPWYNAWYVNGEKHVPVDFNLSDVSLAHWFIGDGNSYRHTRNEVRVALASNKFSIDDVRLLESQLSNLGIKEMHYNRRQGRSGAGIVLYFYKRKYTTKFMDLVSPHIVPSYSYKIKYPL